MAIKNRDRSWPLHPLSLGLTFVLVASLSLVNLYPRVHWIHINYYLIDGEFAHGWPLVYMKRDSQIANADMGGVYHGAWPFQTNPGPVRRFRLGCLACNIVVAVMLVGLTIALVESRLHGRRVHIQFSIGMMLAATAIASILLAIQREVPLHWYTLHMVPNCVVILSLICSCIFVVTRIYQRMSVRAQHERHLADQREVS